MNGFTLLIGSAVIFLIAYVVYGSWLDYCRQRLLRRRT